VSGESREEAFALLRDTILPALVGRAFGSLTDVVAFLEKCDGKAPPEWVAPEVPQSSAWCGVDLGLIDAFGHAARESVRLGVTDRGTSSGRAPRRVRYSGVVSAEHGLRYAVSLLKMRAYGFPQVKLKDGREGALGTAGTARRILGGRVDLRVDANISTRPRPHGQASRDR
jgi:hypothetical protein